MKALLKIRMQSIGIQVLDGQGKDKAIAGRAEIDEGKSVRF